MQSSPEIHADTAALLREDTHSRVSDVSVHQSCIETAYTSCSWRIHFTHSIRPKPNVLAMAISFNVAHTLLAADLCAGREPAYLLNVQLVRVSSGILGELLPVAWQNVELRNDIKEAATHALCPSQIGVQLVLAPQLPCPRKVICLNAKTFDVAVIYELWESTR